MIAAGPTIKIISVHNDEPASSGIFHPPGLSKVSMIVAAASTATTDPTALNFMSFPHQIGSKFCKSAIRLSFGKLSLVYFSSNP